MTETLIQEKLENSVILKSISWLTFGQLLEELGDGRNTRLAYNGGVLEIMSPVGEHESNRPLAKL